MKSSVLCTFFILAVLSISLLSCNDESGDPAVIQLLINSSVEAGGQSPNRWFSQDADFISTEWTSEQFFIDSKSLKISSDNDDDDFGYWGQRVRDDIPFGRRLRLSAMIKLENVVSDDTGVSLVIRGDDDSNQVFFYTTQGDIPILGDQDWAKYSILLL